MIRYTALTISLNKDWKTKKEVNKSVLVITLQEFLIGLWGFFAFKSLYVNTQLDRNIKKSWFFLAEAPIYCSKVELVAQ